MNIRRPIVLTLFLVAGAYVTAGENAKAAMSGKKLAAFRDDAIAYGYAVKLFRDGECGKMNVNSFFTTKEDIRNCYELLTHIHKLYHKIHPDKKHIKMDSVIRGDGG